MTSIPEDAHRSVELSRTAKATFVATNVRGGSITMGEGNDAEFSPVELLLAAIAGCSAIDVDYLTGKVVDPLTFDLHAQGDKVRDENGNHLVNLNVTFAVTFPPGEDGDEAQSRLPTAIAKSRDRLCTVSRTVQLGEPVTMEVGA